MTEYTQNRQTTLKISNNRFKGHDCIGQKCTFSLKRGLAVKMSWGYSDDSSVYVMT